MSVHFSAFVVVRKERKLCSNSRAGPGLTTAGQLLSSCRPPSCFQGAHAGWTLPTTWRCRLPPHTHHELQRQGACPHGFTGHTLQQGITDPTHEGAVTFTGLESDQPGFQFLSSLHSPLQNTVSLNFFICKKAVWGYK